MTRWPRAASLSIAARHREASIFSSPVASGLCCAEFEHALRRALDGDETVRADGVQGRHESIAGIEGNLLEPRRLALRGLGVHAGLHREGDQRALHRIAVDDPIGSRLSERGVVAKERSAGDCRKIGISGGVDRNAATKEFATRLIAASGRLEFGRCGQNGADRHLVQGERAGLVRADRRHRAQASRPRAGCE